MEAGNSIPRGRIISYLKSCKMISKGCLYHIVRVTDLESDIPPIESIPVVKDFPEIFFDVFPGIPHEREIDFGINFLPRTIESHFNLSLPDCSGKIERVKAPTQRFI